MVIMDMKSGIYMWTSPSGKSYIGQSVDLERRKRNFFNFKRYGGKKINDARKKYNNLNEWDYKVLEYCDIDMLDKREAYYIELYNTINNGYNCESGGNKNKVINQSTRERMRTSQIGKHCKEKHPLYGKHHKEEAKHKMSLTRKGKYKGIENSHSKKVVQYTIEGVYVSEYDCVLDAMKITDISNVSISYVCNGKQKTAGGFKWVYKNPTVSEETMG